MGGRPEALDRDNAIQPMEAAGRIDGIFFLFVLSCIVREGVVSRQSKINRDQKGQTSILTPGSVIKGGLLYNSR